MKKNTANDYDKNIIFFLGILITSIIILLSFSNISIYLSKPSRIIKKTNTKENIRVLGKKDFLLEEKDYWEKFLNLHPNYFPGWLELTKIEIKLNEKKNTQNTFSKAFKINPNSQELINLKREIN